MAGWALTIDGCPYYFGTAEVGSVASWSPAADAPTGAALVPDSLARPDFEIVEMMHPADGALDWSGLTFLLYDRPAPSGPALGQRIVSWLATRDVESQIINTVLAATLSASAFSFTVADASLFPAGSQVVHIDQEAILCDSRSGNTFTVNASGRGYLGSRAVSHGVDTDSSYFPAVWAQLPDLAERRVVFWRVDAAGAATRVWAGYTRDTPELDDTRMRYALACVSAWEADREVPLGDPNAVTALRGYNRGSVSAEVTHENIAHNVGSGGRPSLSETQSITDTADQQVALVMRGLAERIGADATLSGFLTVAAARYGGGFQFTADANGAGNVIGLIAHVGRETAVDPFRPTGTDPRRAVAVVADAPAVVFNFRPGDPTQVVPVTSTVDLPATWTPQPYTDAPFRTVVRPVLRGYFGDAPVTVEVESVDATNRVVVGAVRVGAASAPADPGAPAAAAVTVIDEPVALRLATRVTSDHWAYALKRGVIGDDVYVQAGIDPRDWDFSLTDQLAGVTAGPTNAVEWYIDGQTPLRDLALPLLQLAGAGIGVRGGRLAPVPYRLAVDTDGTAAVVTRADLTPNEKPAWTVLRDGLVSAVTVSQGDAPPLTVRDRRSAARYRNRRPPAKVDLAGTNLATAPDPRALALFVLARLVGLWGRPVAAVTLPVTWSFGAGLGAGDFVQINEWLLPDQTGGRGLGNAAALALLGATDQRGFIYGRTLRPGKSQILLHCLVLPRASGWAPCAKVASYDDATKTLTLATGYAAGTATDYAGSNLAGYRFAASAPNDGGTSWFAAGYKVQLVVQDNVSLITENFDATSVDPATRRVVLGASPSVGMQARIAGGEWVNLRFSDYTVSGTPTAQKAFAFVGNIASGEIGGTGDRNKRFAP